MALTPGTRLGSYEIAAQIGLNRQVAIKVLPEAVASNPERLARFDREAKTLAALIASQTPRTCSGALHPKAHAALA